ncbi:Sodium/dicarboxylate symporter [Nitrosococcus oceani ATCC 19707]|uniref:Sodium/dicarboxylate symporter n=2 Tax=Nitrosococcus oceani TaxID=1229 RepID=Q3JAA4_NITOC|nr:dicarboxylate/amino acid:cation symporter [Nitrosococcus oceani]ABA58242.1 Sodium/dicarboxylate symporter [Nitrosococcus oceani ATCC 19707]EDZ67175.1 transporter, DAACS family [Nitrosococcus oceani AFC27]KFI19356.1 sodium:dicarboxylate symporter [Nitrosococcus oceani C-27]GEM20462.1 dicarboxylate/amino acid:cation symporter [Nitrosococcus oceani]
MPHRTALILLGLIIVGVIAGVLAGWYAGPRMEAVAWLGALFLNALKMTIIPLILSAVITGVASLGDVRKLGRVGTITIGYYACTTAIAVAIGLLMVNLIQPGSGISLGEGPIPEGVAAKGEMGIDDILLSLVSPNLVNAAAEGQLLPLIVFAILFSATLTTLGDKGQPVLAFFEGVNEAMMKLVVWIMYLAPVGIFALIAARLGQTGGGEAFLGEVSAVGWHVVTVLSGLALHFGVLLLILFFITGRGWDYLFTMLRALLTAFGTASSSATLPLTMECVRENGIDPRAVRFVLPLGSTINMDGTALYESAAAMFIAQAYGISLGLEQQALIFVTATLAAIGAAGIPEAGLVTLVIVLNAVGLPLEGVGLLLAVDWFLDRFRTSINVWGDSVGAAVLARFLPNNPS